MPKPPKTAPRKLPTQARARDTVEAIIQATTYILTRSGFELLTTNHVAERAGVNIATLYQYFPNKESLLVEVMRRHVTATRAAGLLALRKQRGRSLRARLRAQIEAIIAAHRVAPELHRVLTEQASRLGLPRMHTDSDAELDAERESWLARGSFADRELSLWIAQTTIHAVVHLACSERPDALNEPRFVDELSLLLARYLKR
jgi:AcrR family transcriptional regulator